MWGSLNEKQSERGYAHFIEHMAFNETKHFPNEGVLNYFNQSGLIFGTDVNAVTDYTRTVYRLSLPDKSHLPQALKWMNDVIHHIDFKPEQIDVETDIIFGEWRFDDIVQQSWEIQLYDQLLADSPYDDRDPIGKHMRV